MHSFPRCTRTDELQAYLGEWLLTRQRFGTDMPDNHLRTMFYNMLPDSVQTEVRKLPELDTLPKLVSHVQGELARFNDARLSMAQSNRLKTSLGHPLKN